ncbi:peptidyl-tRNA hydrolase [Corynebacterium sp. TAE3-ERU12]|uniref:aminoacyl-tRNA hydrolase n=1 Tax=Corynebacterium sp. TAE3-ERU12 TaxID=2849491 RepID=UPI001C4721B4|nr:aminoacyl-tRNA hydrolase [Corynebacterium sp. TAE3-ERU12]MBV7294869.1 peptidyl-tRNA hydrolase [Corynebacterium sp. TAE3-ERU12]
MGDIPAWFVSAYALLRTTQQRSGWEDPNRPETVRAMPMVLRIEKANPPQRIALLQAAGASVALACLHPLAAEPEPGSADDGAYREALACWYGARIRKIARRARGKKWRDVQAVAGATAEDQGAQVRSFIPGPLDEVDPRIGKLQISGTDIEPAGQQPPLQHNRPTIYIDADLGMSVGKAAAQVGHAAMLLAAELPIERVWAWWESGCEVNVREVPREVFQAIADTALVRVADAGYTEVAPGSVTVCAVDAIDASDATDAAAAG